MAIKTKYCTKCSKSFSCGRSDEGHVCWCENLPPIQQIEEGGNCLCPECLKQQMKSDIEDFVLNFRTGKSENIAPKYAQPGKPLVEGVDYYKENDLWVFTEWYHLKRGYCCGSGCRHCPYPKSTNSAQ